MNTNSGAHGNSSELSHIWSQLTRLYATVGEHRARITRLERLEEARQHWEATTDTLSGSAPPKPESLLRRIFQFRELVEAVVALVRIAKALPWGSIVVIATLAWKWAYPIARDTALACLRYLGL